MHTLRKKQGIGTCYSSAVGNSFSKSQKGVSLARVTLKGRECVTKACVTLKLAARKACISGEQRSRVDRLAVPPPCLALTHMHRDQRNIAAAPVACWHYTCVTHAEEWERLCHHRGENATAAADHRYTRALDPHERASLPTPAVPSVAPANPNRAF